MTGIDLIRYQELSTYRSGERRKPSTKKGK